MSPGKVAAGCFMRREASRRNEPVRIAGKAGMRRKRTRQNKQHELPRHPDAKRSNPALLRRHESALGQQFAVSAIAIFGATARDEASDASDIDVLVRFDGPTTTESFFAAQNANHFDRLLPHAVVRHPCLMKKPCRQ